jgi:hypothetical protein
VTVLTLTSAKITRTGARQTAPARIESAVIHALVILDSRETVTLAKISTNAARTLLPVLLTLIAKTLKALTTALVKPDTKAKTVMTSTSAQLEPTIAPIRLFVTTTTADLTAPV